MAQVEKLFSSQILVEFVNYVTIVEIGQKIEIADLISKMQEIDTHAIAEYNPAKYPALLLRFTQPKATIAIFSSGKINCTSTKSREQTFTTLNKVKEILKKCNIRVKESEVKIVNIVASINLKRKVDLEKFARCVDKTMFEPEQFPAVIYRMSESPGAIILLYSTGRFVCTNCTSESSVFDAADKLRKLLEEKSIFV